MCPKDLPGLDPSKLLDESQVVGKKRYATHDGKAFAAQCHGTNGNNELWHGYPIGWEEVPPSLRIKWIDEQLVTRRQISSYWILTTKDDES